MPVYNTSTPSALTNTNITPLYPLFNENGYVLRRQDNKLGAALPYLPYYVKFPESHPVWVLHVGSVEWLV